MISVAIVTVTYNAEKEIRKTIESVLMQDYYALEYYVMDGLSTDMTKEIAESYEGAFYEKKMRYCILSQKDNGIYDAMNKSLNYISADYVLFLNAGDFLTVPGIISSIFNDMIDTSFDVVYGNYYAYNFGYRKRYYAQEASVLYQQMLCTHQAIFTKVNLLKKRNYKVEYKMAADYDFYLEMFKQGKVFKKVNKEIVYFEITGVSQKKARMTQEEKIVIQLRNNVITKKEYKRKIKKIKFICLRKWIVQHLPDIIRYKSYEKISF